MEILAFEEARLKSFHPVLCYTIQHKYTKVANIQVLHNKVVTSKIRITQTRVYTILEQEVSTMTPR